MHILYSFPFSSLRYQTQITHSPLPSSSSTSPLSPFSTPSTPPSTSSTTTQTSPDGNVTLSIINYVPSVRDAGKYMSCRAENPEIPDSSLEDGWKLEIHCECRKNMGYVQIVKKTGISQCSQGWYGGQVWCRDKEFVSLPTARKEKSQRVKGKKILIQNVEITQTGRKKDR